MATEHKRITGFDSLVACVLANAAGRTRGEEEIIHFVDTSGLAKRVVNMMTSAYVQSMQAHVTYGPTTEEGSKALMARLARLCSHRENFVIERGDGSKFLVGFVSVADEVIEVRRGPRPPGPRAGHRVAHMARGLGGPAR